MASSKERREPEEVPAVETAGRRFEAPLQGVPLGYAQDGGIVTARDAASGQLMWSQRVYPILYDDSIEGDKQDVFITRLELSTDGRALWVNNERGERFCLGLVDRAVKQVDPGSP